MQRRESDVKEPLFIPIEPLNPAASTDPIERDKKEETFKVTIDAKAGHELAAVAWLQAYLAAVPTAPNAETVRKEITRLEIATEAKVRKIFDQAISAADRLADMKEFAFDDIARSKAAAGDIEGALEAQKKGWCCQDGRTLWEEYAEALVKSGDLERALDLGRSKKNLSGSYYIDLVFEFERAKYGAPVLDGEIEQAREVINASARNDSWKASNLRGLEQAEAELKQRKAVHPRDIWIRRAEDLSKRKEVIDLDGELRTAADLKTYYRTHGGDLRKSLDQFQYGKNSPRIIVRNMSEIASTLGLELLSIRVLEKRLSQQSKNR